MIILLLVGVFYPLCTPEISSEKDEILWHFIDLAGPCNISTALYTALAFLKVIIISTVLIVIICICAVMTSIMIYVDVYL